MNGTVIAHTKKGIKVVAYPSKLNVDDASQWLPNPETLPQRMRRNSENTHTPSEDHIQKETKQPENQSED
jgi:hypothetical protein